jgi:hypothetical protein
MESMEYASSHDQFRSGEALGKTLPVVLCVVRIAFSVE